MLTPMATCVKTEDTADTQPRFQTATRTRQKADEVPLFLELASKKDRRRKVRAFQ